MVLPANDLQIGDDILGRVAGIQASREGGQLLDEMQGLLHVLNGFFGLPAAGTAVQVVLAFLGGTAFFVTFMATGSLLVCALLHAAWDFGTLGRTATGRTAGGAQVVLLPLTWLIALAGVTALLLT